MKKLEGKLTKEGVFYPNPLVETTNCTLILKDHDEKASFNQNQVH